MTPDDPSGRRLVLYVAPESIKNETKIRKRVVMFVQHGPEGYSDSLPGIKMKTLSFGEKTLMTEFLLERGAVLPEHRHPHEQTGYLVSGKIVLSIEGEEKETLPGDSWCIPSNAGHGAKIIEDSVAIEVFSPRREDYLPR
jgi:quercetin dioxygenase-like cupin family protein